MSGREGGVQGEREKVLNQVKRFSVLQLSTGLTTPIRPTEPAFRTDESFESNEFVKWEYIYGNPAWAAIPWHQFVVEI